MKVRYDYVTNSSSSSYIIAMRDDITPNEKLSIWHKHFKSVYERFLNDYDTNGWEYPEEDAMGQVFPTGSTMKLDNWTIESGHCSNEDDLEDALLYYLNSVDAEKYKFKHVGY